MSENLQNNTQPDLSLSCLAGDTEKRGVLQLGWHSRTGTTVDKLSEDAKEYLGSVRLHLLHLSRYVITGLNWPYILTQRVTE